MLTIALTLLITAAGCFALGTIAASLHRYGPAVLGLRKALAGCPQLREARFTVTEIRVGQPTAARILRPEFGVRTAPRRPAFAPLRAAA